MLKNANTEREFEELVLNDGLVLVDFYSETCNPCKMLAKELEQIEGINIVKVNIEEVPLFSSSYGVMGVPTLAVFVDGEMVNRKTGFMPKEAVIDFVESNS